MATLDSCHQIKIISSVFYLKEECCKSRVHQKILGPMAIASLKVLFPSVVSIVLSALL